MPVGLLEHCLHACSARQLARIEDETRCVNVLFCLAAKCSMRLASFDERPDFLGYIPVTKILPCRQCMRKAAAASYPPLLQGPLTM